MNSFFIQHKHARFHYRKYGSGSKLVVAFHGYGRDSSTFYLTEKILGSQFTVIAIDLPFHGLSEWDKEYTFHPSYLVQVIQEIRKQHQFYNHSFTLLGFSMGGRIALTLAQLMHKQVERLVLIAPDGLRVNFWHWFATHTYAGHRLLHYTVHHPQWLLHILNGAERVGLITKSIAAFVHYYMDDEDQRLVLFRRWITMRKFRPRLGFIKKLIKKDKITTRLLFGRHDKVILYMHGEQFIKGIEDLASVTIVDAGHNLLHEYNAARIARLFND